jgi:cytoskeleton protein RodZ
MPTLGEELKRRREERGITLSDISEATRIGTRFLKAIEENDFSALPGGIFTRSFIRAYARQVGMDEDEAIGRYQQQTGLEGSAIEAVPAGKPSATGSGETRALVKRDTLPGAYWPTIVIAAAIIFIIVIGVVALLKRMGRAEDENPPAHVSNVSPKVQAGEAAKRSPQPVAQTSETAASPSIEASQQTQVDVASEPIRARIEATTSDSWVRYQVDDAKPVTLILKPGQGLDLPPARFKVRLNIGNRQTLKLKINNRDANFPPNTKVFAAQVEITRENLRSFLQ